MHAQGGSEDDAQPSIADLPAVAVRAVEHRSSPAPLQPLDRGQLVDEDYEDVVDVVLISAADECRYLKEAIGLGALDYLIKPFSFDRFRSTLNAYTIYRRTLDTLASGGPLSQEAVDGVFSFRTLRDVKESIGELPKGLQEGTLEKIIETLRSLGTPVTCEETAASAGIAPATVRRYLGHLVQKDRVSIDLEYRATGRPVNRYRLR